MSENDENCRQSGEVEINEIIEPAGEAVSVRKNEGDSEDFATMLAAHELQSQKDPARPESWWHHYYH